VDDRFLTVFIKSRGFLRDEWSKRSNSGNSWIYLYVWIMFLRFWFMFINI